MSTLWVTNAGLTARRWHARFHRSSPTIAASDPDPRRQAGQRHRRSAAPRRTGRALHDSATQTRRCCQRRERYLQTHFDLRGDKHRFRPPSLSLLTPSFPLRDCALSMPANRQKRTVRHHDGAAIRSRPRRHWPRRQSPPRSAAECDPPAPRITAGQRCVDPDRERFASF
jgi:hypothetical protein